MTTPTTITESTLKTYMDEAIGEMADVLTWTVAGGDFDEPVDEALNLYGISDIATISTAGGVDKIKHLARVVVWRKVVGAAAAFYTYRDQAGAQYNRKELREAAKDALRQAEMDAMSKGYAPTYEVGTAKIHYEHDPYGEADWDEKDLTPQ